MIILLVTFIFVSDNLICEESAASQTPAEYLQSALELIKNNALNSSKINWQETASMTTAFVEFAVTTKDTYPIIKNILKQLDDNHSYFLNPVQYTKTKFSKVEDNPPVISALLEDKIGYISIPGVKGYTDPENLRQAQIIQDKIAGLDSLGLHGWIVDLQKNTGGNMWPMLAGLGPLLGEGIHGYMVMSDGNHPWIYRKGSIGMEDFTLITLPDSGYVVSNPDLPIAVLIGEQTMSSGEAAAISFIGKKNTKFFGKPTRGLSTVNVSHKLSDGAQIVLTEGIFADSSGKIYGDKIVPDVVVEDSETTIQRAAEWILKKP